LHYFDNLDKYTYDKSYYYFIKYFENKKVLSEEDLVISANFTYAWMPTILNFKNTNFNECVDILNKSKQIDRLEKKDIEALKSLINNSLVGTSKLLHFINPNKYAIWDSRVSKFLSGVTHKYFIEKTDVFFQYIDFCNELINHKNYENEIHQVYLKKSNNQKATKMKSIEQIMFLSSEDGLSNII
jgi:hypothetical protein